MDVLESRVVSTIIKFAIASFIFVLIGTPSASAQDLKVPNSVFIAAATADWVSTYQFSQRGARETNPLIKGLQSRPAVMVAAGAGIDLAGLWLWNRYVGKSHPRLAAVGLYAATGFRVFLAARNNGLNRR